MKILSRQTVYYVVKVYNLKGEIFDDFLFVALKQHNQDIAMALFNKLRINMRYRLSDICKKTIHREGVIHCLLRL